MFNLMLVVQLQKINGNMHFNVTRKISARLRMHGAFTHTRMVSEKMWVHLKAVGKNSFQTGPSVLPKRGLEKEANLSTYSEKL